MSLETNQTHPHKNRCKTAGIFFCLVILVCSAIRIRGAWNDLTLDEILSLNDVSRISSPAEIFTKLHVDNNHYLNSLWMYFAGDKGNWPGYRIPSILAGIGTIVLAWLIGRRRNCVNAWMAMLLVGFSYVLVLYSGQARGYSGQVFFSFLSFYILNAYLKSGTLRLAVLFWLGAIFGFLSHINFVTFFGATVPWAAWHLHRSRPGARHTLNALLLSHAVPGIFLAALYAVDIRHIVILGGSTTTLLNGYSTSLAWVFPPFAQGADTVAMFIVVAAGVVTGCWMLWREKSDSLVFFAGVIVVFPILLVAVLGSTVLYVRYFIEGIAFALLLLSMVLASLYARGFKGRVVCLVVLLAYLIANGRCILLLFKDGQGNYSEAIRYMAGQTGRPVTTIGANRDFGVKNILPFYAGNLPPGERAAFYPGGTWPKTGLDWVVFDKESYEAPIPPGKSLGDPAGNRYVFVKTIPAAPLSGQHWFLYRNKAEVPASAEPPPKH